MAEPFDWDKESEPFDWSTAEEVATPSPFDGATAGATVHAPRDFQHIPSASESFVHNVANVFGTGDLIGAGFQAALQEASDLPDVLRNEVTLGFGGGMPVEEAARRKWATFSDARKENLRRSASAMEHHPVASIAGRMAPGVMLAPATGLGNTWGLSAISGGLSGGIEGAASSDEDTVGGVAADTGRGMAFGTAGGLLGHGAGRYVLAPAGAWVGQKVGNALAAGASDIEDAFRRFAQERALKAAGYIQKDFPRENPSALRRLLGRGQTLLDEPGLVTPGASAANINTRLEPLVEREGQRIGGYLDAADAASWSGSAGVDDVVQGGGFNPYAFAERARQEVQVPFTRNPSLTNEGEGVGRWLGRLLQTEREQAAEGAGMTFRQANQYKGDLQNTVFNPNGLPKANKQAQNELQRTLTEAIDEQAEPLIGAADVEGFRDARRRFGAFTDALEKSQQQVNREVGNNFFGLKDMQAGQMAQGAKGLEDLPYIGPAAALGSKLLRGRMDSTAARAADAVAGSGTLAQLRSMSPEVVGGYGAAVGATAGGAVADWLTTLAQTNPEALGKWGQYLGQAAAQSPEALGAAHRELSETDPEYQDAMRRNGGQSP